MKSPDLPFIGIYYDKTNIPKEKPSTVARSVMIRTKSWKLVLRSNNEDELYDLMYDPIEINNLINIHGYEKIKINLKEQLLRWYLKTSDNPDWRRIRLI
ncbi:MAG: sulfatase/phosphatase domain-containing protein [Promethearchaeota archaeon]